MSRAHIMFVTFNIFKSELEEKVECPQAQEHMRLLCKIFGLYELMNNSTANYETGYFTVGSG